MSTRLNILSFPHKAYRAALSQLMVRLTSTDVMDDAQLEESIRFIHQLGFQLDAHARHEDEHLQPYYDRYMDADVANKLEQEHQQLEHAYAEIERLANQVSTSVNRDEAWYALSNRVHHFVVDYLAHLVNEDFHAMPILWNHMSDDELRQIHQKIMSNVQPQEMPFNLEFGLPSMTRAEQFEFLAVLKRSQPESVFARISDIVRSVLGEAVLQAFEARLNPV